jgi:hypothetical protein
MTLLAWLEEAWTSEMPLLCPVAPAGLEFSTREKGHGTKTCAAETEGEGWDCGQEVVRPVALVSVHLSFPLALLCP